MLLGEFPYTIDDKGRIFIPAKFREELGAQVVVSKGFDECLCIYSIDEFSKFTREIEKMDILEQRDVIRFFCGGSCDVSPDKQGRIVIPQSLRNYAGLEKEIMVIGAMNKAEVWDKAKWEERNSSQLTSDAIIGIMRAAKKNIKDGEM